MAIDPDLTPLRKEIDRLLRERRPDRYDVHAATDDQEDETETRLDAEWLDKIAEEVSDFVPDEAVRTMLARKIVGQREGAATRTSNSFLRKINDSGQLVLGWWDLADDPMSVITRVAEPGKRPRVREERVALRAATERDFRAFANEERKRAAADFAARNSACEGADWIADQLAAVGARNFWTWAVEELPPDAEDE